MKRLSLLLILFSAPAFAGDAYWPGTNDPRPLVAPVDQSELDRQLAANRAHMDAERARMIEAGGINADDLPVWVATDPKAHWRAFGSGPQMGSE